ncbi:helix-turn-helix domain-containing protein [Streptomyces sp. MST-110588]|uniref:AraC-like ligand-binding domain-containing protein n=1 Tax=Streptomyces sp. MST-110588 TaxID=2833628 RepID=UPI001F5CC63B|nr:helix-turn-helix domain-containing protein [Streptomyces sp. MST-110588]UNO42210.1 helix-turn-helix domain-containing protein [Streptomyces sp. MST-110588]
MLNETVIRSDDVPAGDRLAYWAESVGQTHAPVRMRSEHADDFHARMRVLDLGAVSVWPQTFQQLVIQRTPELIRRSDPELYHVSLIRKGTGVGTWDDHETVYQPCDLHVNDSSMPWEIRTGTAPVTTVGLELPKALLPLPCKATGRTLPRRIPARSGIGALLSQFLLQVVKDADSYQPDDGPRLGRVAAELVAALLAHAIEDESLVPPDPRKRTLVLRIKHHIQQHLHDPRLTPTTVAAAHHLSVSYLHRLFEGEEATVAAWIRLRRLEAARRELADPALRALPIHRIATRWGFPRAADFSRAFRTAYGLAPRDFRQQAGSPGEWTDS